MKNILYSLLILTHIHCNLYAVDTSVLVQHPTTHTQIIACLTCLTKLQEPNTLKLISIDKRQPYATIDYATICPDEEHILMVFNNLDEVTEMLQSHTH